MAADFNACSNPRLDYLAGHTVRLRWDSTAAAGSRYQVYAGRSLAWWGLETECVLPWPSTRCELAVCAVPAGEETVDYSSGIPAGSGLSSRPVLSWWGGRYQVETIRAFRVYGESTPGGGINYASPLAEIAAEPHGQRLDGFGRGGFGRGGFGRSAARYAWTGTPRGPGTWAYGIKPVDAAGIEGTAATTAVVITAPPRPPQAAADGSRLRYSLNAGTGVVTLSWLASPAS